MRILVVGDWVVDDYWLTGEHRSATASRIGKRHLRALNRTGEQVRTLAGAGRVTALLYEILPRLRSGEQHEIVSCGFWHPEDTDLLHWLTVDPSATKQLSPLRLSLPKVASPPASMVLTLYCIAKAPMVDPNKFGTTRVLRILLQKKQTFESLGRIDWETHSEKCDREEKHRYPVWLESYKEAAGAFDEVFSDGKQFDAIVIKDQRKGVVSCQVMQYLADRIDQSQRIPWFISTKAFEPAWFGALKDHNVRLFMVPEIAASDAVDKRHVFSWFATSSSSKRPAATREALDIVEAIHTTLSRGGTHSHIVVLPGKYTAICRYVQEGIIQPEPEPEPGSYCEHAGMASACFPYLIGDLLNPRRVLNLGELMQSALKQTREFNQREASWIGRLPSVSSASSPREFTFDTIVWKDAIDEWNRAFSPPKNLSGIKDPNIELWRAMTEVDGYVCCVRQRRARLAQLMHEIRTFQAERPHRNVSGTLIAKPGSGKTSLVRALARAVDVHPLEFNVTQCQGRADLFDCFDTIVTAQAQNRGRILLVFFDEINALLENQHVYEVFLSPLEDGVYLRNGRKFFIQPCIWLFASTESLTGRRAGPSDKSADFVSRLTMGSIDLTSSKVARDEQKIENVYRALATIQGAFPDVRSASIGLLEYFHQLPEAFEPRKLRTTISKFENVQFGIVSLKNFPKSQKFVWTVSGNERQRIRALDEMLVAIR